MLRLPAFFDELEKISRSANEPKKNNRITKDRLKRLARYGLAGAAGVGAGYGVGKLVGRPLAKKLVDLGVSRGAAKVLRYSVPTAAGLGAAYALSRGKTNRELFKRVD